MIRLEAVTLREIHLPLVEPFRTVHGEVTARRILLLELHDAGGGSAWSECVAQNETGYSLETVDTAWTAIHDRLAPRLIARAIDAPQAVRGLLAEVTHGHHMARAAMEMGIWALAAASMGIPLARALIGSSRLRGDDNEARSSVASGIALGMQASTGEAARRAQAAFAEGYQRVKLKIEPAGAHALVYAVREAVGPRATLTADANGSFDLGNPAHVAALESLDPLGLAMIEQPLAPNDLVGHAELQRRIRTPVCLDETITGHEITQDVIALRSARIVNLKPGRVGGLTEAVVIHDLCAGAGIGLWCGGMLESGIGRAYNVALASLPGFTEPGDLSPSARYWARDIVIPPWTMDTQGKVKVPLDRPGLGIDMDVDFIDDCTVRTAVVRAP